jgi:hypothetical protein
MLIFKLDSDGVPVDGKTGHELKGDDAIYDPFLRISASEMHIQAKKIVELYNINRGGFFSAVNLGGINHINRRVFEQLVSESLFNEVEKHCSVKARILFDQVYAHKLYKDRKLELCYELFSVSSRLAAGLSHPSWDKWVSSAHLFLARYNEDRLIKFKNCVKVILKPRDLSYLNAWTLYWKLFRAAAWLIANPGFDNKLLKQAIRRFKATGFDGYVEVNPSATMTWSIGDTLDSKELCQKMMATSISHMYGDP